MQFAIKENQDSKNKYIYMSLSTSTGLEMSVVDGRPTDMSSTFMVEQSGG